MPPKGQYACPVPPSTRRFPAEQAMPRRARPTSHRRAMDPRERRLGRRRHRRSSRHEPDRALRGPLRPPSRIREGRRSTEPSTTGTRSYDGARCAARSSSCGATCCLRSRLRLARQVVKYAREYARYRGVTDEVVEVWAPRILELAHEAPLTTAGYRERLGHADLDVATLVNPHGDEGAAGPRRAARRLARSAMDVRGYRGCPAGVPTRLDVGGGR